MEVYCYGKDWSIETCIAEGGWVSNPVPIIVVGLSEIGYNYAKKSISIIEKKWYATLNKVLCRRVTCVLSID